MSLLIGIIAYILIGVLFYIIRLYWMYLTFMAFQSNYRNKPADSISFRYWFYNIHDFTYIEIVYAILWPVPLTLVLIIYTISFICYLTHELK